MWVPPSHTHPCTHTHTPARYQPPETIYHNLGFLQWCHAGRRGRLRTLCCTKNKPASVWSVEDRRLRSIRAASPPGSHLTTLVTKTLLMNFKCPCPLPLVFLLFGPMLREKASTVARQWRKKPWEQVLELSLTFYSLWNIFFNVQKSVYPGQDKGGHAFPQLSQLLLYPVTMTTFIRRLSDFKLSWGQRQWSTASSQCVQCTELGLLGFLMQPPGGREVPIVASWHQSLWTPYHSPESKEVSDVPE